MKVTRGTVSTIITILAALILVAAIPAAVRDTFETGRVYLFSSQFLDELPQRLTGPGRLRFVFQPLVASWGCAQGWAMHGRGGPHTSMVSSWALRIAASCCAAHFPAFATWSPSGLCWMRWHNS